MPGPPPRDPALRRRRNVPSAGDWVTLPATGETALPPLDSLVRGDGNWSAGTRSTWEAWRRDPVTRTYTSADVEYAAMTIYVIELLEREPSAAMAGEVRHRITDLGLSPKGRQVLRLRVASPEESVRDERASSSRTSRARRRRLVAIDATKKIKNNGAEAPEKED